MDEASFESRMECVEAKLVALQLEGDFSRVMDLLYGVLIWAVSCGPPEFAWRTGGMFRGKTKLLPRGLRILKRLIELDEEFGFPLEARGVRLAVWFHDLEKGRNGKCEW